MRLTDSFIECNSCDYRKPWPEDWLHRVRVWLLRRHLRHTGHANMTIRQKWSWD